MVWGRWYKILIWIYINAVQVWSDSKTQIAPWFLDEPFDSLEEFAKFIQMLDDCENGIVEKCGGVLENVVNAECDPEPIRRYWITIDK